jgi:hypothetical protein
MSGLIGVWFGQLRFGMLVQSDRQVIESANVGLYV